ncbi:hypothetical protein [Natronobiforma cellulositropha]|uniref:hypothetical protein n=1 Tax=Natronobiforma cellulositropha TaxID=1679076 RepID=UPI0021D612C0|nr:hypothetical protein [Natronobiforma cellulositropha]
MSEKWSDPVLWYSVGVAVLLGTCILYTGALTSPYSTDGPSYAIAHESAEPFERYVEGSEELREVSPTPIAALSPETQRAFEEIRNKQPRGVEYPPNAWQQLRPVSVCDSSLLYCDEYANLPEFPSVYHETHEAYGLVEVDGDEYLVRTSSAHGFDFSPIFELIVKALTLGWYAVFLLWTGLTREKRTNRRQTTYATVGLGLAGAVLIYPYSLMLMDYSPSLLPHGILALVSWGTILAGLYGIEENT